MVWSHVICRCWREAPPPPRAAASVIREELLLQGEGKLFWKKITRKYEFIYTLTFKSLGTERFLLFLKKFFMLIKAAFIWSKIQKKGNILKYYCNLKYQFSILIYFKIIYLFLWCSAEFSASLLQSSVSHDPSEIILIYDLYQCWNSWYQYKSLLSLFINLTHPCW